MLVGLSPSRLLARLTLVAAVAFFGGGWGTAAPAAAQEKLEEDTVVETAVETEEGAESATVTETTETPENAEASDPDDSAPNEFLKDPVAAALQKEYERLRVAWVEEMSAMQTALIRFHDGSEEDAAARIQIYQEHQPAARQAYSALLDHVVKMLEYNSDGGGFLWEFIARTIDHRGNVDWYEGLTPAAKLLAEQTHGPVSPKMHSVYARSLIVDGDFATARTELDLALQTEERLDCDMRLVSTLSALEEQFVSEQKRLAADPDDLPRVEFQTTRGPVVIELYEDQAPNTVANFLQLVEEGFYDELPFYQVMDQLFAMTGDPIGDGSGSSGKTIADESDHPDARSPLRGSLVMAKIPVPDDNGGRTYADTASSQFMILLLPLDLSRGEYTVFGRVIEGMDAIAYLNRIDPSEEKEEGDVSLPPDRVQTAKVLRKRDHEYKVEYLETSP